MTDSKIKLFETLLNDKYGMFPAPISAELALEALKGYLLGENFYITDPVSKEQEYTEVVFKILMKYSREFRKDCKLFKKLHLKFKKMSLVPIYPFKSLGFL